MANKKSKSPARRFLKAFLLTIIFSVTVLFVAVNFLDIPMQKVPADVAPETTESNKNPDKVVATASLSSVGDLLIHAPVFNSVWKEDGTYEEIFVKWFDETPPAE